MASLPTITSPVSVERFIDAATSAPAGRGIYGATAAALQADASTSKARRRDPIISGNTFYVEYWANRYRSLRLKLERARIGNPHAARYRAQAPLITGSIESGVAA